MPCAWRLACHRPTTTETRRDSELERAGSGGRQDATGRRLAVLAPARGLTLTLTLSAGAGGLLAGMHHTEHSLRMCHRYGKDLWGS